MLEKPLRYLLLLAALAGGGLVGCRKKLGSHSLRLRLRVELDSTALTVINPSGATYYRTEVDVNDAFRWHPGTLPPGARRTIRLDSLRSILGQRLSRRMQIADIWCYAQDSAGNFDAFTWHPTKKRP
jgi:hypothetical protein